MKKIIFRTVWTDRGLRALQDEVNEYLRDHPDDYLSSYFVHGMIRRVVVVTFSTVIKTESPVQVHSHMVTLTDHKLSVHEEDQKVVIHLKGV